MKKKKLLLWFLLVGMVCVRAWGLTINSLEVLDSAGSPRSRFSNTELVTFRVSCLITDQVDRIEFKFYIYNPSGMQVFYHTGNSIIGTPGRGGSELKNVPLTFYTIPGEYQLKVEIVAISNNQQVEKVTATKNFSVYSPNIVLTYPPNGSRDISAQPLIFRWISSGASRYKIYVSDEALFFKPLLVRETYLTEFEYPQETSDQISRLSSGKIYWWKVEGLDIDGRTVATTQIPFSFSIKDTTVFSQDVGVSDIYEDEESDEVLILVVVVTNYGNQSQSNIGVTISGSGLPPIPPQTIPFIGPGESKQVKVELPVAEDVENLTLSVGLNLTVLDGNPKNNSLSRNIKIKEKAKIVGRVIDKVTKKPINSATIEYSGPISGKVESNPGGQYKISKLRLGDYTLSAVANGYKKSEPITVTIKKKATTNVDFYLEQLTEVSAEEKEMTPEECWAELKLMITDKKILDELNGYSIYQIDVIPAGNITQIINQLKSGKLKVLEWKLEKEE